MPAQGSEARRLARRAAIERLAASIRALADAAVETDIEPDEISSIAGRIDALSERLRAAVDATPYSGLTGKEPDYSTPAGPMPLNPIIGPCSPVRPDVQLDFSDGRVVGRANFSKRFVGPPGCAHGGISALLADQLVSVAPLAAGHRTVTRDLAVRYRRPLPLHEEIELEGWCETDGDAITATCEIRARGDVAVRATANLARYEDLARHRKRSDR